MLSKLIPIIYGMTFFIRRIAFVLSIMFLSEYLLWQLSIQIVNSLVIIIMLLVWKPLNSTFANIKEVFNEFTILLMSYIILSFTGAESDPEKRAMLGRCLIGLSSSNILFHLIILFVDTIKKTIKFRLQSFLLQGYFQDLCNLKSEGAVTFHTLTV